MAPSPVPNKGRSTQSRSSIANLTTIDYHESLLDQNRQLGVDELEHETMALRQTRRWINKRPNTSGSGRGTGKSTKKNPAVSRQDFEEFKALPIAVRRKVSRLFIPLFHASPDPTRTLCGGDAILAIGRQKKKKNPPRSYYAQNWHVDCHDARGIVLRASPRSNSSCFLFFLFSLVAGMLQNEWLFQ